MSIDRNMFVSIATFIKTELDSAGYTNVSFTDAFPEDDEILMPDSRKIGEKNTIVIPALAIYDQDMEDGSRLGLGESSMWTHGSYTVWFYGLSKGQQVDVLSVLRQSFKDKRAVFYDYSLVGCDWGSTSPTTMGYIEFESIRARSVRGMSPNEALKFGGQISFRATATRNSVNS